VEEGGRGLLTALVGTSLRLSQRMQAEIWEEEIVMIPRIDRDVPCLDCWVVDSQSVAEVRRGGIC
jgi:hypothetical protein